MYTLKERLEQRDLLVADGAMGTELQGSGLEAGNCSEEWNLSHLDKVSAVARRYVEAGSDLVYTNTFGANRIRLSHHGLAAQVAEINKAGVAAAREGAGGRAFVVASIGPTGDFLEPLGMLTPADAYELFLEQAEALIEAGVDGIVVETFSALEEIEQAIRAVKQVLGDLPLFATMSFEKGGRTMMGVTPEQAVSFLADAGADVVGANCSIGPDTVTEVIKAMHNERPNTPLLAKANAGLPELVGGKTVYTVSPEQMAAFVRTVRAMNVVVVGGCCGTSPLHIAAMASEVAASR